jgi:hypothetical protein
MYFNIYNFSNPITLSSKYYYGTLFILQYIINDIANITKFSQVPNTSDLSRILISLCDLIGLTSTVTS